jgi:Rrf2 family protein
MLSQTAEYALRSVLFLADQEGVPANVEDIAEALGVPRNYLSKTLHRLASEGILHSTRGKGGGFRLGLDPEKLTLLRIVEPFGRMSGERRCLLGRPQCSDRNPCPAHNRWKTVSEQTARFFRETTVSDLVRGRRATA